MADPVSLPDDGLAELVLAHRRLAQRLAQLEQELDGSLAGEDPAAVQTCTAARLRWRAALEHMGGVVRRLEVGTGG